MTTKRSFTALRAGSNGQAWLHGFAPATPQAHRASLLILPPLFSEANRCRKLMVDMATMLVAGGCRVAILDLPGCGESETPLEQAEWADWQSAVATAGDAVGATHLIALRGGCLLGDDSLPRWHLASVPGARLIRDLERAAALGGTDHEAASFDAAGYRFSHTLADAVRAAIPVPAARDVALAQPGETVMPPAHSQTVRPEIIGEALWRRAEPGRSLAMARAMADDVERWIAS